MGGWKGEMTTTQRFLAARSREKAKLVPGRPVRSGMAIQVGIGSWADAEYTGVLFPAGLAANQRLKTYATHFNFVEVNSTYYATPRRPIVATWAKQTPPDFLFH